MEHFARRSGYARESLPKAFRNGPFVLFFIAVIIGLLSAAWDGAVTVSSSTSLKHDGFVRFMTYNIHWGLGTDRVHDLDRIADVLRRVDADVVVLTEVDINWRRSGNTDQPAYLAKAADYPYWYFGRSLTTWASGNARLSQYGNLILSRFPIVRAKTVALPRRIGREPRSMLIADVRIGSEVVTVVGTHLGLNEKERLEQVTRIRRLLDTRWTHPAARAESGPRSTVLMGDFNARPSSREIALLTRHPDGFVDTHVARHLEETDALATFPYPEPYARIDYIFVSPDLAGAVIASGPLPVPGSDHLPVVADIAWPHQGNRPSLRHPSSAER